MTDADLIYHALLRAERKAEATAGRTVESLSDGTYVPTEATATLRAINMIRQEIGAGLATVRP